MKSQTYYSALLLQ